jgi:hypothetical protein
MGPEKRKKTLHFKINLIDLGVVFSIIACMLYLGHLKVKLNGKKNATSPVAVTYKVQIQNVSENFAKLPHVGDTIQVSSKKNDIANIKDVEIKPYEKPVFDAKDKKFVISKSPDQIDIILTLEGDAMESDSEITIGDAVIAVGESGYIDGFAYSARPYITEVSTAPKK